MKKIFVSFLILSCLAKPLSICFFMLEEIGDIYPNKTQNVIGCDHRVAPRVKLAHAKICRIEESPKRPFYPREKFFDVDSVSVPSVKKAATFIHVSKAYFLFTQIPAIHLRSPPATL